MLELRGITAGYGRVEVLREINLRVPSRSVVALLGPNGAGKTTLLRVASGLLKPSNGGLYIDDDNVTGRPPNVLSRRGVCHVPEGRGIFPNLSVRDHIAVYAGGGDVEVAVDKTVSAFPILGQKLGQLAH